MRQETCAREQRELFDFAPQQHDGNSHTGTSCRAAQSPSLDGAAVLQEVVWSGSRLLATRQEA
jgi:hypothetical protein